MTYKTLMTGPTPLDHRHAKSPDVSQSGCFGNRARPLLRRAACLWYRRGAGDLGSGLTIILTGKVDITWHYASGRRELIVSHNAGHFMGELAQLAGRPPLVDTYAQ